MNKARITLKRSEDAELLIRFIRDNDDRSFEKILCKYKTLVWNVCCRLLNNRCDAEDAFQATFMLLASRARRIRNPKSLSSWLYGVAYRTASSIRKQRHRDLLPFVESMDEKLEVDILERVAKKNENELVSAELMLLKDRYKTPLLMFYFLGKSCREIADALDLSVTAVESRLRQAKRTLKHRLRLRGLDLTESCAALAVPALVLSPNLVSATVNSVTTASVAKGLGTWVSSFYSTLQPTGAKLMLFKTIVACGMIGLLSVGLISHGASGFSGGMTVVDGSGTGGSLPIKFVADEDEEESFESTLTWWHNHIHDVFESLWSEEEVENRQTIVVDLNIVNDFEVKDGTEGEQVVGVVRADETPRNTFTLQWVTDGSIDVVDVGAEAKEQPAQTALAIITREEKRDAVPYLSSIPYIGQLFKSNEQNEQIIEYSFDASDEDTNVEDDK